MQKYMLNYIAFRIYEDARTISWILKLNILLLSRELVGPKFNLSEFVVTTNKTVTLKFDLP